MEVILEPHTVQKNKSCLSEVTSNKTTQSETLRGNITHQSDAGCKNMFFGSSKCRGEKLEGE